MYKWTKWLDHVTGDRGEVIQEGTLFDQDNMNKIENGIADATLAAQFAAIGLKHLMDESCPEVVEATLTNSSVPWPFGRTPKACALNVMRNHTRYEVNVEVLSYTGGQLGKIQVLDKARNGFKLVHEGSAKEVKVRVTIRGGMF